MNQFDRVFRLHTILSRRRAPLSLRELADRMECSRAPWHVADVGLAAPVTRRV